MPRHSGQPFNEDHPDYERLVLNADATPEEREEFVVSMQAMMPPRMLLALLHDEMHGLKWNRRAVWGSAIAALLWVVLPVAFAIGGVPWSGWATWAGLGMAALHGMTFAMGFTPLLQRMRRWNGMLGPLHIHMHQVVADIEGDHGGV